MASAGGTLAATTAVKALPEPQHKASVYRCSCGTQPTCKPAERSAEKQQNVQARPFGCEQHGLCTRGLQRRAHNPAEHLDPPALHADQQVKLSLRTEHSHPATTIYHELK